MPPVPAPDDAISFECRSIGVHRPGLARRLSQLSAAVLVAPAVLAAVGLFGSLVGLRLGLHFPHEVERALITGWFLGTPALAIASAIAGGRGPEAAGRIEVTGKSLRAVRKGLAWSVHADSVVAGLVVPTLSGPAVDLQLDDGRVLRAGVETEEQAHALLDRLGIGPDRRRVSVPLRSGNTSLAAGCVAFPVTAVGGIIALAILRPHDPWFLWAFLAYLVLVSAVTLAARRLAAAPEVVIGADGVLVRRTSGTRLLRFAEIEGVSGNGGELVIDLRHPRGEAAGERLVMHGADAAVTAGLAARITEAMALVRRDARAAAAALLDPGDKPLDAWREALGKLLHRGADYRQAAVDADDLLAVLEDGSAPPARRIGAALALREGDRAEARQRVRIAADACADEEVRAALEAAAEEEVDEAPIRRVMEAGRG